MFWFQLKIKVYSGAPSPPAASVCSRRCGVIVCHCVVHGHYRYGMCTCTRRCGRGVQCCCVWCAAVCSQCNCVWQCASVHTHCVVRASVDAVAWWATAGHAHTSRWATLTYPIHPPHPLQDAKAYPLPASHPHKGLPYPRTTPTAGHQDAGPQADCVHQVGGFRGMCALACVGMHVEGAARLWAAAQCASVPSRGCTAWPARCPRCHATCLSVTHTRTRRDQDPASPAWVHDMAYTGNHIVICEMPLFFNLPGLIFGEEQVIMRVTTMGMSMLFLGEMKPPCHHGMLPRVALVSCCLYACISHCTTASWLLPAMVRSRVRILHSAARLVHTPGLPASAWLEPPALPPLLPCSRGSLRAWTGGRSAAAASTSCPWTGR